MEEKFETGDNYLSTYFEYSGEECVELRLIEKKRVVFCFEKTARLFELLERYHSHEETVKLQKYLDCYRNLKSRMFQARGV